MLKKIVFVAIAAAALATGSAAVAQTVSELLEKGIYTEETVGDLDAAIKIYEKIVGQDQANRQFVAQAQFRLGNCLARQGKKKEAEKVLQELVDQFSDSPAQKDLVEKAQKLLPASGSLPLQPVPWTDGEQLEIRIKLGGGMELGVFTFSARAGKTEGRDVWYLTSTRNIIAGATTPNLGYSEVIADGKTFDPIRSIFRHSLMGTCLTDFAPGKATVHTTGLDGKKSDRTTDLTGVYYDNEQGWYVFRRLPLADGFKATVPIFSPFGAGAIGLESEVTGSEKVDTPAGTFDCYKLFLKPPVQQTFWISSDAHRYVVKFEAGGVTGVLQSIRRFKPGDTITQSDDSLGISMTAPADWYFLPSPAATDESEKTCLLLDPEAMAVTTAHVRRLEKLSDQERKSVRAWAEKSLAESGKATKDQQVRGDSWQEFQVSGLPAVRCTADFLLGDQKRSMYRVFVLGRSTAVVFSAHTSPGQLDEFRAKLDPIIDSYKEK